MGAAWLSSAQNFSQARADPKYTAGSPCRDIYAARGIHPGIFLFVLMVSIKSCLRISSKAFRSWKRPSSMSHTFLFPGDPTVFAAAPSYCPKCFLLQGHLQEVHKLLPRALGSAHHGPADLLRWWCLAGCVCKLHVPRSELEGAVHCLPLGPEKEGMSPIFWRITIGRVLWLVLITFNVNVLTQGTQGWGGISIFGEFQSLSRLALRNLFQILSISCTVG